MSTLDSLSLEILFRVFDFINSPDDPSSSRHHPLNSIAATNRYFDSAAEEYTRALLKRHANFAPQKKSKTYSSRRKWLAEICQFCYKKSKRRSTLWRKLTCCLACDKKHFPKVTMTNAIKQYQLSKLDLFTPNRLHPTLPPLAHGEYAVSGCVATMIYEPDLISRRDYILSQLSSTDRTESQLRKRIRRHDALTTHMEIGYSIHRKAWLRSHIPMPRDEVNYPVRPSMRTGESRDEFVRKTLAYELTTMHVQGASEDVPIEFD
ncbi:hypothetical protein OPT61_g1243 [Boeremia exigua]|uniref:Uncharacterized protein n=1 Tax=Boeremia exigua TaxID=749465 RepID=A0ACC2IQT4_9PLEO|nr:hypothetical protein OPT61_g1243 [Boeremia exigua]